MRITRENTIIEDKSYPLAGMREDDICDFLTAHLKPFEPVTCQIQAAIFLHNVPLYITMLLTCSIFLYSFKVVSCSEFPTMIFIISLYPLINLILLIGGKNVLQSMCIQIPQLPESAPDRIRPINEIIKLGWKPIVFLWRVGFFIYRTYLCPNVVDIVLFLFVAIVSGLLLCTLDGILILSILVAICLILPPLITREWMYNFIIAHLGHPFPEQEEEVERYYSIKTNHHLITSS